MRKRFLHHFKGFGVNESDCFVYLLEDDGEYLILFEDIDSGTSVTNASEQIASEIVNDWKLDPENCRFFETYRQYDHETFDEIKYDWVSTTKFTKDKPALIWMANNAKWTPALEEKKVFLG
jgi:hypothetical protein